MDQYDALQPHHPSRRNSVELLLQQAFLHISYLHTDQAALLDSHGKLAEAHRQFLGLRKMHGVLLDKPEAAGYMKT